jgi:hypothetical protein
MKTDVEQGLAAMREWNVRNYMPDMKKFAEWRRKIRSARRKPH